MILKGYPKIGQRIKFKGIGDEILIGTVMDLSPDTILFDRKTFENYKFEIGQGAFFFWDESVEYELV